MLFPSPDMGCTRIIEFESIHVNMTSQINLSGPRQANLCLRAFRHDKF